MNKKYWISIIIVLVFGFDSGFSQTILTGNLFSENKYSINPAYAGLNEKPHFYLSYRKIATSVPGVPESLSAGASAAVFGNMGLGGRFFRQTEGLFDIVTGFVDYSYKLKINKHQRVRFGISAGFNSNNVDQSKIVADDPGAILGTLSDNYEGVYFETSAGIAYQWKKLDISVAVPRLFESRKNYSLSFNSLVQYTFELNENIDLRPSVFAYYHQSSSYIYETNLQASWKKKFWVGAGYRNRPAIIGSVGVNLNNLGISYSAELGMGKYSDMFNHVHQVRLAYTLGKEEVTIDEEEILPPRLLAKDLKEIKLDESEEEHDLAVYEEYIVLAEIEEDEEEVVFVQQVEKNEPELEFDIEEAGDGIFIVRTENNKNKNTSSVKNTTIISETDTLVAENILGQIDVSNEDYKFDEIGPGMYVVSTSKKNNSTKTKVDNAKLDSLVQKKKFYRFTSNQSDYQMNTGGRHYHSKYYTVRLYIDDSNSYLLTDARIVDMARIERNKEGYVKYYYGYFSSKTEAERQQKRLNNYAELRTKVMMFNSFQ